MTLAEVLWQDMALGTSGRWILDYGITPDDLEAAVLAWIGERLDGAREDATEKLLASRLTWGTHSDRWGDLVWQRDHWREAADVALAVVRDALGVTE